jgi:sulfite exporter TauE/SafE
MCGPLTLLLPNEGQFSMKFIFGRIFYNFGRIVTYSLLGATTGFFGEKVSFFISQKTLSISFGIVVLAYVILPITIKSKIPNPNILYKFSRLLKGAFAKLFKSKSFLAQFSFGLVNGLLPCGMVYVALAGAFLATNWTDGGLTMLLFGVGTVPLMLPISLGMSQVRKVLGANFKSIISLSYVLLGVWLIFRGMDYDIQSLYTSPKQELSTECVTLH